jgi:hypothetical protein
VIFFESRGAHRLHYADVFLQAAWFDRSAYLSLFRVVVAELDVEKDAQMDYSTVMAAPLKPVSHS